MSNKERPLVSAIIPTYGRLEQCVRAVESVEAQTYDNIELIVVETPSGSDSELASRIERITSCPTAYVETERGIGVSEARNIGIGRATGRYLAFLDDDDEWLPKKIETQIDRLESAPESVRASVTGNIKIDPDGETVATYTPPDPDDVVEYQLCWNIGTFSMLVVHEEICHVVGGIDESLSRHEDKDFLLRIAQNFDFDIIDEELVKKHVGRDDHLGRDYDAGRKANEIFSKKHSELAKELDMHAEMESALEFSLGRTSLANEEYALARRHFAKSLYYRPFDRGTLLMLFVSLGGPVTYRLAKWADKRL
jgi:glycosyltransferase involved in cell wall biosynthesis